MSDPHGKLDCVVSPLRGNGVIDRQLQLDYGITTWWSLATSSTAGMTYRRFVAILSVGGGSCPSRGPCILPVRQHEPLLLAGDMRYTKPKYALLAEKLGMAYPLLLGPDTELGRWLGTRNTMQTIGNDLYVHAGLGAEFYDRDLRIDEVNEAMSRALFLKKEERKALSPLTAFLYGNSGPIWYRGLVRTDAKYNPLPADSLQLILQRYGVERIIVGHTIFKEVSSFTNGKVSRRECRQRGEIARRSEAVDC